MALREILHYPDERLKVLCKPVTDFTPELRTLARDMAETMYDAPGVGLAAPQIGVHQRVIVLDCSASDEEANLIVAINPDIIEGFGEAFEEEGCLSVPGYYARVKRHAEVKVRFNDLDGKEHILLADGLLAICFQHEIDHLNGVLFVDHLSPLKKGLFKKRFRKLADQRSEEA